MPRIVGNPVRARRKAGNLPAEGRRSRSRNLVADQQNAQAMDQPDDSATSVITASELQTYFARLSQESDDDTKGSSNE